MIEQLMRKELSDVLVKGYTLNTLEEPGIFHAYLYAPGNNVSVPNNHSENVYSHTVTKGLTKREIAFAASYFLLGTLHGRGQINMIGEESANSEVKPVFKEMYKNEMLSRLGE